MLEMFTFEEIKMKKSVLFEFEELLVFVGFVHHESAWVVPLLFHVLGLLNRGTFCFENLNLRTAIKI